MNWATILSVIAGATIGANFLRRLAMSTWNNLLLEVEKLPAPWLRRGGPVDSGSIHGHDYERRGLGITDHPLRLARWCRCQLYQPGSG
jgi:hypothetical protein